ALAAGCAAISTPFWYAEDMLASGAGRIVPFADTEALADVVCEFIEEPGALEAAREEARRIGDGLAWPSVAEAAAAVLREASAVVDPARRLLDALVLSLRTDVSLRTAAYAVLGLARVDADRLDPDARVLLQRLLEQLSEALAHTSSEGWRWFEDELRYDNA